VSGDAGDSRSSIMVVLHYHMVISLSRSGAKSSNTSVAVVVVGVIMGSDGGAGDASTSKVPILLVKY